MENGSKAPTSLEEFAAECARIISGMVSSISEYREKYAPYIRAALEHPKWVHYALNSKKKRTRKKYHDRIMRTYGGGTDNANY